MIIIKMKNALLIIIILQSIFLFGQNEKADVYDLPIPRNLDQCYNTLSKTLSEDEIRVIKTYPEDSIYDSDEFRDGTDFFHAWKLYDGSKLTKYFNKMSLFGTHEIYETILISYHRHLNNEPIYLVEQINKIKEIQKADYVIYMKRTEQDSINGVYIPKNIQDCFTSLDSLLSQKDIDFIKSLPNKEETIQFHLGLGMWLRNNWGLWGGSRLQLYFFDKNVNQPDEMSSLILEYYYDWLNGTNEGWMKFDKN